MSLITFEPVKGLPLKESLSVHPLFIKVSNYGNNVELVEYANIPIYVANAKIYRVVEMVELDVNVKISEK